MKSTIAVIALCIIPYTFATQPQPAETLYCLGNKAGDNNKCSACFNTATNKKIFARQFVNETCATNVTNTVASCKYYNPTINATKALTDCMECDGMTWLNLTDGTAKVVACSKTAISTTVCTAAISLCDQSFCHKSTTGTYKKGCYKCSKGNQGSGTVITNVGFPSCVKNPAGAVTNCDYHDRLVLTQCSVCASGYSVASTGTSCTAYATDKNCRKLAAGGYCNFCMNGYYFNKLVCKAGAQLIALSGLIMSLFFFN